jgi:hypothetical protein
MPTFQISGQVEEDQFVASPFTKTVHYISVLGLCVGQSLVLENYVLLYHIQ